VGPFKVIEAYDNGLNVKLDLPEEYSRIHHTFHIDKLKRYTPSMIEWPGRVQPNRPRPVLVDGEEQHEVEMITGKKEEEIEVLVYPPEEKVEVKEEESKEVSDGSLRRSERLRGKAAPSSPPKKVGRPKKEMRTVVKYLVKWKGWDSEYNTWQTIDDLRNAQDLIDEYEHTQAVLRGEESVGLHYIHEVITKDDGTVSVQTMCY
jgi:hypothetical protein